MKIILLGAPGSGKGTISSTICKEYNLMHISTGDLFRAALKKNDDFAKQINEYVVSGSYVPDWITNKIADDAILTANKEYNGFILDGYPRTINQADHLSKINKVDLVILLDVPEDLLIKRISGRRICSSCNAIYNIYFYNKPNSEGICNVCGGQLVQRKDDHLDVVKDRINIYLEQTKSLIDYYDKQKILKVVDATVDVNELLNKIREILNSAN